MKQKAFQQPSVLERNLQQARCHKTFNGGISVQKNEKKRQDAPDPVPPPAPEKQPRPPVPEKGPNPWESPNEIPNPYKTRPPEPPPEPVIAEG